MSVDAKSYRNSSKNRCFAHCSSVSEDLKPFTTTRWNTFVSSVNIWKDLVGYQADIARAFLREVGPDALVDTAVVRLPVVVPEFGGYHPTCYRYFTDSSKQERGKLNKDKQKTDAASCHTLGKPYI